MRSTGQAAGMARRAIGKHGLAGRWQAGPGGEQAFTQRSIRTRREWRHHPVPNIHPTSQELIGYTRSHFLSRYTANPASDKQMLNFFFLTGRRICSHS